MTHSHPANITGGTISWRPRREILHHQCAPVRPLYRCLHHHGSLRQCCQKSAFYKKPPTGPSHLYRCLCIEFVTGSTLLLGGPMYERISKLTNYANRFDKVLGISNMKRLGSSPHAIRYLHWIWPRPVKAK